MQGVSQTGRPILPLNAYIKKLEFLDKRFTTAGEPQNLTIVNGQLYWLQGVKQELYTLKIEDSSSLGLVPEKVIAYLKSEENKTFDEFSPSSKEEELLRERQRKRVTGINSYHICCHNNSVFFISGMDLFFYRPSGNLPPVKVFDYIDKETRQRYFSVEKNKPFLNIQHVQYLNTSIAVQESAEFSTLVTFVYDSNIYTAAIKEKKKVGLLVEVDDSAQEAPFDIDIERVTSFGDTLHECGTADYIMQEEFSRYTGHYATERYILFSYTDTSMLRTVSLLDHGSESGVENIRYCRVGDKNANTLLVVYERKNKCFRVVPQEAIASVAPWAEYIPRFGFKDDDTIYFSLLSRTQEQYCVFSCRVDSLPEITTSMLATYFFIEKKIFNTQTTMSSANVGVHFITEWKQEISWAWVDIMPEPSILFGRTYDVLSAYADNTETVHCHIYIRNRGTGVDGWRQLTKGEWNVKPGTITVQQNRILFIANKHNRLGSAVFSVSLGTTVEETLTPQPTQLSPSDEHVYRYIIKNDNLCYVASTAATPARICMTTIHDTSKRFLINTEAQCGGTKQEDSVNVSTENEELIIPKTITIISRRGVPLSGHLFISPSAVKGKPGPLLMYVYGGPHAQLVYEHNYNTACVPFYQLLVRHGLSVLVADGQMSNANGLRDKCICKNNMGNFETSDYVDFAKHMTTSFDLPEGFIADPSRIAICGWSYGGYATLLAMSQAPDIFKMGFAGAPVGDWRFYDTGYTERYMGELYANGDKDPDEKKDIREAYIISAINNFVSGFPDELNRVFISHGILDENVHFIHTCTVIDAMVNAGKPFVIFTYPGERHGLRQKKASRYHHYATVTKTLVEML